VFTRSLMQPAPTFDVPAGQETSVVTGVDARTISEQPLPFQV
jgi:hypothetical protein